MEVNTLEDFPILKEYLQSVGWSILDQGMAAYKGEHVCRVWTNQIEFSKRDGFIVIEESVNCSEDEDDAIAIARTLTFTTHTLGFPSDS